MDLYINGTGIICGTGNNIDGAINLTFPEELPEHYEAAEPDYKASIPPMQLRRMSKPVRMGLAAAKASLKNLNGARVDAISVGTSLGCLNDTEHFLAKMVTQDEQMLTPTSFIQSTHNTVAGQIALVMGCKGHNMTFVHKGHSFEHAIINAGLYLLQNPDALLIAGGIDEMTTTSIGLLTEASVYRKEVITPEAYYTSGLQGSFAGEGAAFFTVSARKMHPKALKLRKLETFTEAECDTALAKIEAFLENEDFKADLILSGNSGDARWNYFYQQLNKALSATAVVHPFKHLSGEYATATAVALGMITEACLNNDWKHFTGISDQNPPRKILMINNYINYYSCWLLQNDAE